MRQMMMQRELVATNYQASSFTGAEPQTRCASLVPRSGAGAERWVVRANGGARRGRTPFHLQCAPHPSPSPMASVCYLLYDTGSHTKPFSRLRSDMPLLIYPAAMLHDRCEANDFSEHEKEITAYCATSRPRSRSRLRFSRSTSSRATAASRTSARSPPRPSALFRRYSATSTASAA